MTPIAGLTAVVPAGGAGTRLWPLSRAGRAEVPARPDRLGPDPAAADLGPAGAAGRRTASWSSPGRAHAEAVAGPAARPAGRAPCWPSRRPRDSMPAIGLAAAVLAQRDPDAVVGSFAADHVVRDGAAFAARGAPRRRRWPGPGWLVTIGHRARPRPRPGSATSSWATRWTSPARRRARQVRRFVEKPDAATAAVVRRARVPLERRHVRRPGRDAARAARPRPPGAARRAARDRRRPGTGRTRAATPGPGLAGARDDRHRPRGGRAGGRRRAGRRACRPTSAGTTSATGPRSPRLLPAAGRPASRGCSATRRRCSPSTARGLVVPAGGRLVAVVGLDDVVVVDTPDAVLVTTRPARPSRSRTSWPTAQGRAAAPTCSEPTPELTPPRCVGLGLSRCGVAPPWPATGRAWSVRRAAPGATESGREFRPVYRPADLAGFDPDQQPR